MCSQVQATRTRRIRLDLVLAAPNQVALAHSVGLGGDQSRVDVIGSSPEDRAAGRENGNRVAGEWRGGGAGGEVQGHERGITRWGTHQWYRNHSCKSNRVFTSSRSRELMPREREVWGKGGEEVQIDSPSPCKEPNDQVPGP